MARTPEAAVKDSVQKLLKELEVYYFTPVTGGYGRSGVPDLVCCVDGMFLAIECKAGDNKPTPLQFREMDLIRAAQGVAMVVRETNVEEVRLVIRQMRKEKHAARNTGS
jgi:Holliday junction resolvase